MEIDPKIIQEARASLARSRADNADVIEKEGGKDPLYDDLFAKAVAMDDAYEVVILAWERGDDEAWLSATSAWMDAQESWMTASRFAKTLGGLRYDG